MTNIDRIIKDLYKVVDADQQRLEKTASYTPAKESELGRGLSEVASLLLEKASEDSE